MTKTEQTLLIKLLELKTQGNNKYKFIPKKNHYGTTNIIEVVDLENDTSIGQIFDIVDMTRFLCSEVR